MNAPVRAVNLALSSDASLISSGERQLASSRHIHAPKQSAECRDIDGFCAQLLDGNAQASMFVARWRSNAADESATAAHAIRACVNFSLAQRSQELLQYANESDDTSGLLALAERPKHSSEGFKKSAVNKVLAERQQLAQQWVAKVCSQAICTGSGAACVFLCCLVL